MWHHSVNYKAQRDGVRGALVDRGFWWYLPRLMPVCRVLGHKPVVDGTEGFNGRPGHRWVICDRCGVRPMPQGDLSAALWDIGDPFPDLHATLGVDQQPGGWPASPEGTIGGQLIIGGRVTAGAEFKVGNKGSEHVLAGNACIPFVGGLYLHTEGFGTWLQRRLNPAGHDSMVTGFHVHDGRLYWQLWAKRDNGPRNWRDRSARIDPRDILLGERRYAYTDVSDPEPVTLLMPDGGQHVVTMTLQQQAYGRDHGRQRGSWVVHCECDAGIPDRNDRDGGLTGWAVPVSDTAVDAGMWQQEAAAASVVKVTGMRIRYGYRPPAAGRAETGLDRVQAAVRRSRGGDAPATVRGFA